MSMIEKLGNGGQEKKEEEERRLDVVEDIQNSATIVTYPYCIL